MPTAPHCRVGLVPAIPGAWAPCRHVHADGDFESSFPIMGKITWRHNYDAILATPMRLVDVVAGELLWIGLRLSMVAVAFTVVLFAFGVPQSALVVLAVPAAVLTGLAFSAPIWRTRPLSRTPATSTCCSASSSRRCSSFPACSSR
jgi:hypothetical protein